MIDLSPPTPLWARAQAKLQDTHAVRVARSWLDERAWALVLLGGVGRGKSQAAAWLWHALRYEAIEHAQRPGHFEAAGEVLWLRARTLGRLDLTDRGVVLGRLSRAYGLVLDELGHEDHFARASPRSALSDLVEQRGDEQRRTVITSNLPREKFVATYGDRLMSRLHGAGRHKDGSARWVITVQGDDLRGHVADEKGAPAKDGVPLTEAGKRRILAELEREGIDRHGVLEIARRMKA